MIEDKIGSDTCACFRGRRPVYERFLQRKHHMPLDPPSEAEKRDAIDVLRWEEDDELYAEAFLIFDEASE